MKKHRGGELQHCVQPDDSSFWEQGAVHSRVQWFPRSLCFMWFWFGLEILRQVYKKAFFKILNRFYLIWPFPKNSTVPYKSWKKISSKLGTKGIKRSGILRLFQKCVELLRQEVPKDFFSRKMLLQNFLSPREIRFTVNFFPLLNFCTFLKSASFDTLCGLFWRNFFEAVRLFLEDKRSSSIF